MAVMDAPMRIFIVENDPVLRRLLTEFLQREGIEVLAETGDGEDALRTLGKLHPDLILTDCDMPGCTGIELVQRLRAAGDHTPVVMLSGQSDSTSIAIATAAGVNRYLVKPVAPAVLSMALRQAWHASAA
jgi:CheY-like chemotaxis protein